MGDLPGVEVDDRLAVEHESIFGKRGVDPLQRCQRAAGLRGVNPGLVAAVFLCLVERGAGAGEDLIGGDCVAAGE